jgi:dienelactone hydrolase
MTAPLLILIGEADEWNSADACETLRNRARPDSAPIDLTIYPGVHHAFDVAQLKPGRRSIGRWVEYDELAARDAADKTRAFLAEHLARMPTTPRSP